jgi:hypothetical protein
VSTGLSRRGPWSAVELANDELAATLLPGKGCDVVELVDRRTGVDVLFRTPWGYRGPSARAPSSFEAWIETYPGGWQLLLPNGGDAAVEDGVERGFHGEAALVEWWVDELDADRVRCSTSLVTAPLDLVRTISLERAVLRVEERVTNAGGDPVEVIWAHHPAFGAPVLEPGVRIEMSARTFTPDDRGPGAGLEPGAASDWPHARLAGGGHLDLSVVPPHEEPRAVLGYLSGFREGTYRIVNARIGLAVELRWPLDLFPTAWFWQELRASPGYPWYRRVYTTALEPSTTAPAQGIERARAKGGTVVRLAPGESRTAILELELVELHAT